MLLLLLTTALAYSAGKGETTSKEKYIQWISPGNIQPFNEGEDANNNFIVNYWREATGYDIDVIVLPLEGGAEKLNLLFNSGDAKGLAWVNTRDQIANLAQQELIIPLDDYMATSGLFKDYAFRQPQGIVYGKQYAWVTPEDTTTATGQPVLARVDKLKSVGLGKPPVSAADFEAQMKAFKDAGMLPFAASGGIEGRSFSLFQSYFTIQNDNALRDGKVVYPKILPEAKEYLTYMRQLYVDGYIPKDYQIVKEQDLMQLYLSEKAGFISFAWPWNSKTLIEQAEPKGFETMLMDYPTNKYGERGYGTIYKALANAYAVISANCKDPQAVLDFMDLIQQGDLRLKTYYGNEGEHFDYVNGTPIPNEGYSKVAWGVYYRIFFTGQEWFNLFGIGNDLAEYYYPTERNAVGSPDIDPMRALIMPPEYSQKRTELFDQIIKPYYNKVVIGDASIEDFDSVIKQFMNAGGAKLLADAQKAWEDSGEVPYPVKSQLPKSHPEFTGKYIWK
jgi:putative aldouronate transport system substrate-binding protein